MGKVSSQAIGAEYLLSSSLQELEAGSAALNSVSLGLLRAHAHKEELTARLADTCFCLNIPLANILPGLSWKFKAARSQTPLADTVCKKLLFVFGYLFFSTTKQLPREQHVCPESIPLQLQLDTGLSAGPKLHTVKQQLHATPKVAA